VDKLHEKTQQDVFVASFSAMEHQGTGQISTYCVWAKGCLALLPRTDRVAFVQEGRDPAMGNLLE